MPCREFVEFLDEYLSDRLSPERRATFNEHLSGCPPCVAYMQTYQETVRRGRALLEPSEAATPADVPEALVQAILAARAKTGS